MSLPVARPLKAVSPSAFGDLLECQLRVAFKQHAEQAGSKSDAQVIGDSLHAALAAFIEAREFEQDNAVELAGARFAAKLEDEAPGREVRGVRPAAARLAKVARRVLELLEEAGPGAMTLSETYLRAREGQLHGVVDLIIESERLHLIVDYKTGRTIDEDGEVLEHFQTQVQLYAVLERERCDSWPERGVLLRFGGPPIQVDVNPDQCAATADRAVEELTAYNTLEGRVPPASPSEASCRFCSFATQCPAFWEAVSPGWGRGAVRGRVAWAEPSATGGLTVALEDVRGSFVGSVVIRRVDERQLGAVPEVGAELIVCGVHPDRDGRLLPDRYARMVVGHS
jgi:CRISPR/Cas system-associated exonuclease Cas4 (RecB family)